jgi:hypothetical protein
MSRLWAQSAAGASGRASNLATSLIFFFRSATLRTVSNSYLVNLALSDILLSTLACPITLGNTMAKICSYVVLRKGDLISFFVFITLSTLLYLQPLKFHWVELRRDQIVATSTLAVRGSNHSTRSHPVFIFYFLATPLLMSPNLFSGFEPRELP